MATKYNALVKDLNLQRKSLQWGRERFEILKPGALTG
jgi:hypothetical protein